MSRGPHGNKNFESCVKNKFIWKNKQNELMFPSKYYFYDVRGPRV